MTIEEVYAYFGKQIKLAEALQISKAAISLWFKKGYIPHDRQIEIEKLTKGILVFRAEDSKADKRKRSRRQLTKIEIIDEISRLKLLIHESHKKISRYEKYCEGKQKNDS